MIGLLRESYKDDRRLWWSCGALQWRRRSGC